MTTGVPAMFQRHNPDVLSCIANLSNDEVFTPPELANQMLDALERAWADSHNGANVWADSTVTFLDPFTKSGVFLREIVSRLIKGLEDEFEDLQARVDHILTRQVFGIGITRLTSLLARRSVYCSKYANGSHSVASSFDTEEGNIWFERTEHSWEKRKKVQRVHSTTGITEVVEDPGTGRCRYCGAQESAFNRDVELETHAYAFTHTDDIKARVAELFGADMQFDVIIGNPPYQMSDGGHGNSAAAIYPDFVDTARRLEPRYLTMVIPSRWFSGGKGVNEFRDSMLSDRRIRSIDDFLSASDVFPGVGLKGGVCYFLWDRDHPGDCQVRTHFKGLDAAPLERPLLELGANIFVRFNTGISILRKVAEAEGASTGSVALPQESRFDQLVSSSKPFGLRTFFRGKSLAESDDLTVYQNGGTSYIERSAITTGLGLIDYWKVFVGSAAPGTGNRDSYPHRVLSTPFLGAPGSICSETYLCVGPFDSERIARNVHSYLRCRFTRLLILLHKATQHTSRKVYSFVPVQDFEHSWTDEMLYEKYGLTNEEIKFIESMVRPMELGGE